MEKLFTNAASQPTEALLLDGSEVEESRRRACIEGVGWQGRGGGGGGCMGGHGFVSLYIVNYYI